MNAGGERAVRIINQLTHTRTPWAGEPFKLRPWQARILHSLFHTGRDGRRQIRTCLLMLPRKNRRRELAAASALDMLLFEGEIGGEIYLAAADRDQAGLVFGAMVGMIRNDPELEAACDIIESHKRIVH